MQPNLIHSDAMLSQRRRFAQITRPSPFQASVLPDLYQVVAQYRVTDLGSANTDLTVARRLQAIPNDATCLPRL